MSTPFAVFGPGIIIVTRTDLVTPAPINIGYAQELSLDFSGTTKPLFGQNQFPLVSARGTTKITGKIKAATLSGIAFNNVFFGNSFSGLSDAYYFNEAHTVASTTQAVTHATGGIIDLGLTYVSSGLPLQRVASSPSAGQYSVVPSTGTYTFNASDEVAINFNYAQIVGGAGQQLLVTNQPIGFTPTFQLDYYNSLNQPTAQPFGVRLLSCVASKLTMAGKLEDYMMPEFDFDAFAAANGQVLAMNLPQVS